MSECGRLPHLERQLVLLIAAEVGVAHEVERVRVLARVGRRELELDLVLVCERDALDTEQRVRLDVANHQPPALLLDLRKARRVHGGDLGRLISLTLECDHDRYRVTRRHLVLVLHFERELNRGVHVAHARDVVELCGRHLKQLDARVVLRG